METLRAADPIRMGAVTLVPVLRIALDTGQGDSGCWITASAEPVAVVICDGSGIRALAADRSEIVLETLVARTPNLAGVLAGLSVP